MLSGNEDMLQSDTELYSNIALSHFLFQIAATSLPRNTPKLRQEGDSFLRRLFDEIKHCLDEKIGPASSVNSPKVYTRSLKMLLEEVVKYNVQIDMATIESILKQASGLYHNNGDQQIEWELIGLCLRSNADVFILSTRGSTGIRSYMKPNDVLEHLFILLHTSVCELRSEARRMYKYKISEILIPLLNAFARARDLSAFLGHWKKQMDDHHAGNKPQITFPTDSMLETLWVDEDLLVAASDLVAASLPANEINTILAGIETKLRARALDDGESLKESDLLMLDCVIGGCRGEELLSKLCERAQSVHEALATAFVSPNPLHRSQQWRLWRVFASINRRWSRDLTDPSTAKLSSRMAETALRTLEAKTSEPGANSTHTFREQSFAFCAIASLALPEYKQNQTTLYFGETFQKSMERILDLKAPACHQLTEEPSGVLRLSESLHGWDGKTKNISSIDTLYLSCIAQLLDQSSVLRHLDATTIRRMLQQLWQLARNQRSRKRSSDINYPWLWDRAQSCEAVYEQPSFATSIRQLQYEEFMDHYCSNPPTQWKAASVEYDLLLNALSDAPLLQFDTKQVVDTADKILDVVICKKVLGLSSIARHLQLLVKFADAPRYCQEQMRIFQNATVNNVVLQEKSVLFVLAETVARESWSREMTACNDALCRLTIIIMRYVKSSLTYEVFAANVIRYFYTSLDEDDNARYFTMFYQWIGRDGDRASTKSPTDSSGWTLDSPMLLVTSTGLNYYHINRQAAMKTSKPDDPIIENIRRQHFKRLLVLCKRGTRNWRLPSDRCWLAAILECLSGYSDVLAPRPELLRGE